MSTGGINGILVGVYASEERHMTLDGFTFPDFVRRCFRCGDPIDDHAWGFFVNARKPDRFEVLCSSCEPKQRDSWPGGAPFSKTFYAETYGRLTINDRRLWLASRFDAILRLLPLVSKQHVLDLTAWSGETADVRVQDSFHSTTPALRSSGSGGRTGRHCHPNMSGIIEASPISTHGES